MAGSNIPCYRRRSRQPQLLPWLCRIRDFIFCRFGFRPGERLDLGVVRDRPTLIIADPVMTDLTAEQFATPPGSFRRTHYESSADCIEVATCIQDALARAKEAGFNEYLVTKRSGHPFSDRNGYSPPGRCSRSCKRGGYLMAFLSAKGGTGTSSFMCEYCHEYANTQPEGASPSLWIWSFRSGSIAGIVGYVSGSEPCFGFRSAPCRNDP